MRYSRSIVALLLCSGLFLLVPRATAGIPGAVEPDKANTEPHDELKDTRTTRCCLCFKDETHAVRIEEGVEADYCALVGSVNEKDCRIVDVFATSCTFTPATCDPAPLRYRYRGEIKSILPPENAIAQCGEKKIFDVASTRHGVGDEDHRCDTDRSKFCWNISPTKHSIESCMREHAYELSDDCRKSRTGK